jgi:hypothetical protein
MMLMAAPHRIICLAESCNKRPATCDSGKIPSAIHTTLKRALNSPSHGYLALPPVMDSLCRAISARDTAQCRISHFVAQFLRETPLSAGSFKRSKTQHPMHLQLHGYIYISWNQIQECTLQAKLRPTWTWEFLQKYKQNSNVCAGVRVMSAVDVVKICEITYHVSLHNAPHKIWRRMADKW